MGSEMCIRDRFLQYGAMVQRDIDAGRSVFGVGAQAPMLSVVGSGAMSDATGSKFKRTQGGSLPELSLNPLKAAGFGMDAAADASAIPMRAH